MGSPKLLEHRHQGQDEPELALHQSLPATCHSRTDCRANDHSIVNQTVTRRCAWGSGPVFTVSSSPGTVPFRSPSCRIDWEASASMAKLAWAPFSAPCTPRSAVLLGGPANSPQNTQGQCVLPSLGTVQTYHKCWVNSALLYQLSYIPVSSFQYVSSFIGSTVVDLCKCVFQHVQKSLSLIPKANGSPNRMIYGDVKRNEGHLIWSVLCSPNVCLKIRHSDILLYVTNHFVSLWTKIPFIFGV